MIMLVSLWKKKPQIYGNIIVLLPHKLVCVCVCSVTVKTEVNIKKNKK